MDDLDAKQGIEDAEKYVNLYIPENSQGFADEVENYATTELPPAFDHLMIDFVSPFADEALTRVRERIGDRSPAFTFIDLQQILSNEILDLEDQEMQFSDNARKKCEATVKRLKFTEESILKIIANEELDTVDIKAVDWYIARNIDRWNKKGENKDQIATQNESYFASLNERLTRTPIHSDRNSTEDLPKTIAEQKLENA